ncbi:hypothetical protein O9929_13845 [Vibrio lentus]|nr:hypothetical protein [Vibrio lentus]
MQDLTQTRTPCRLLVFNHQTVLKRATKPGIGKGSRYGLIWWFVQTSDGRRYRSISIEEIWRTPVEVTLIPPTGQHMITIEKAVYLSLIQSENRSRPGISERLLQAKQNSLNVGTSSQTLMKANAQSQR